MTPSDNSLDVRSGSAASGSDRRKAPRYGLMAIAELTDPEAAKLVSGDLTQISRTGCYVATPKTFAVGTPVKVIVSRDERTFVARASVIHTQEQMGMGLAFLDPPEDQLRILDSWLTELPPSSALAGNPPR
jgi:PilZ domain